jgi:hypothetical protein
LVRTLLAMMLTTPEGTTQVSSPGIMQVWSSSEPEVPSHRFGGVVVIFRGALATGGLLMKAILFHRPKTCRTAG